MMLRRSVSRQNVIFVVRTTEGIQTLGSICETSTTKTSSDFCCRGFQWVTAVWGVWNQHLHAYSATLVIFRIHHPKNVFKIHSKHQYIVKLVYVASLKNHQWMAAAGYRTLQNKLEPSIIHRLPGKRTRTVPQLPSSFQWWPGIGRWALLWFWRLI